MEIGQGFSFGLGGYLKKFLCFAVCCIFNEKGNKNLLKKCSHTCRNVYISTTRVSMADKLGRVATYYEGLLRLRYMSLGLCALRDHVTN